MAPLVYVIVLNWNGRQDTAACLESCLQLSYPRVRLLVVDNGSVDGSEEALRERFPDVPLLQTGKNLGFAGGNNVGIRYALEHGAEFVLLLNNDTVVDPRFVDALVAAAADPAVGMLIPKIYYFEPPDVLWYAGAYMNEWLGWGNHLGAGKRDVGQFDAISETNRPTGCALMVRRAVCETVGLLAEEYFCYCEDLDWGLRARNAGFKLLYVPTSKVWHKISRSTGGSRSGVSLYYYVRNLLLCLDRNHPLPAPLRLLRHLVIVASSALGLFTMRIPKRAGAGFIWRGARDYYGGHFGERAFGRARAGSRALPSKGAPG
jgi:GT2 family glycosyltransferase